MSNNESFIDEVTDEVRRDRLYALFRRYGWIGVVAIIGIVAASAWTEWSRAREAAAAQAFGDAVIAALAAETTEARTAALDAIAVRDAGQRGVVTLLKGAEPGAAAALDGLASDPEASGLWRAVAEFRRLTASDDIPAADRRARFEVLAAPGAPLRLLAEEQIALIEATAGERQAAIDRLTRVADDTAASSALRSRARQMIVALGGTPGG